MTHIQKLPLLAVSILAASLTLATNLLAQTDNRSDADTPAPTDSVAAARAQYAPAHNALPNHDNSELLAQYRGGRRPPFPSRREYSPRQSYQSPWMDQGDARHALIGGAIGFAIGAGLAGAGNHGSSQIGGRVFIGGSICGLIGAAIGSAHGSGYPFARRRRAFPSPSTEDEEATTARPSAISPAGQ
jgi:hypothetical protein